MSDAINEPDPTPADPAPEPRTRWRDRVFAFRGVLAVALASVILGGVGGAAIGVAASGDGDPGRHGPAHRDFQPHGGPGMPGTGELPVRPPEDEVEPDNAPSGSSNGG